MHACRNPQSDDSVDHHCLGPHSEDEPWYCVDCGHEGPEPLVLPDGTVNGNALARLGVDVDKALLAVLELHRPFRHMPVYCSACWPGSHEHSAYPCPTVRAVAKAMGIEVSGGRVSG